MFENRIEAGKLLAQKLASFKKNKNAVVVGVTRGGVILAKEISLALKIPFDIIVIKKIGAPYNPELAIGAVGPPVTLRLRSGRGPKKTVYWEEDLCRRLGVTEEEKKNLFKVKNKERKKLEKILRVRKLSENIKGKTVILVDDGVATGATVMCARSFFEKEKAKEVVLATPVMANETFYNIKKHFKNIIVLKIPDEFYAIGQFYREFGQVENEEVVKYLTTAYSCGIKQSYDRR